MKAYLYLLTIIALLVAALPASTQEPGETDEPAAAPAAEEEAPALSEAVAEEPEPAEQGSGLGTEVQVGDDSSGLGFGLAPRVGLDIPTSELGLFVVAGLELDLLLPVGDQQLVLALDGTFSWPRVEGSDSDTRLPGDGSYDYELKVLEIKVALDVIYRFLGRDSLLVPFVGVGPVLQFLRTTETTSINDDELMEKNTAFGFEALAGLDLKLGPGAVFLDVRFVYTKLEHELTGDTNAGNVTIAAGYRFLF